MDWMKINPDRDNYRENLMDYLISHEIDKYWLKDEGIDLNSAPTNELEQIVNYTMTRCLMGFSPSEGHC
jgi:hypothetical protein